MEEKEWELIHNLELVQEESIWEVMSMSVDIPSIQCEHHLIQFGQGSKAGDLNSFIKGIGDFFKNMAPAPSQSTQVCTF